MNQDYTLEMIIKVQDEFSAQLKELQDKLQDIKSTAEKTGSSANNILGTIKKWVAALWLTAMITKATKSIVTLADNLEQSSIAFETMLWSADKAKQMLSDLSDFAVKTPFEIQWVRQNAQQLIAMWVSADDIIPTLKSLWDVSAWLNVPLERLALNYGQVIAQWKLTGRELRDFTMAWVPLLDELSNMLWVSTTQIQNMISAGQITSNDVVQAFQNMTSEWGRFADLMSKQATTLSWLRSNFQDNLSRIWEEVWTELLPTLKWYVDQIEQRTSDNKDMIIEVAGEIFDAVKVVIDNVISSVWEIREAISPIIDQISEWWSMLMGMISGSNEETVNWIKWDWSDLVYGFKVWITAIVQLVKTVVITIVSYVRACVNSRWDILWNAWAIFSALRSDIKNWALNMAEWWVNAVVKLVNWVIDKLNRLSDQIWIITGERIWGNLWHIDDVDFWWGETWKLKEQLSNVATLVKGNFEDMFSEVWDAFNSWLNAVMDVYANRIESVTKEATDIVKDSAKEINTTVWKALGESNDDTTSWWSWSWSSSSNKEREKRIKEAQKEAEEIAKIQKKAEKDKYTAIQKQAEYRLKNQQQVIEDLNDSYEDAFNDIQKNIDETQKHIDSLNNEIASLQETLANTKMDETKSIAKEVVNTRKELKALEEQYEWLAEVANSVSREDLEWVWWIKKFDVDLIKKYKDYQDELASMYNWMTAEEQQALDKEIEYAEWYDSLNWIEKIKEDYRIRKEEIQSELDEKVRSLDVEMETKRLYMKEQQKLQDERVKRIDEEVQKRENVANMKKEFEAKYMEILEIDHTRQVQMTNQLVEQWNAVYRAKMRAMSAGSDWSRASGWPVYSGNSYLVWEAWPELFIPSTNWKIVKNSDIWNTSWSIEINVNMWWVSVNNDQDVDEMARKVSDVILRDLELYQKWIR